MSSVHRIDLLSHNFSRSLRGYNAEEVESFLQDVADNMGRMSEERLRMMNRIAHLESRVNELSGRENALQEALVATRKMTEEMRAQAQKEAQLVINTARARAESLTNQANARLAKILDEIEEARKLKAQFEFRVRSVIESHLKLLELGQNEDDRMDRATAALRPHRAQNGPEGGHGG